MNKAKKRLQATNKFVRQDVSFAVIVTLIVGIGVAIYTRDALNFIPFFVTGYVLIGLTTVNEWHKELLENGMVSRSIFNNVTTAIALPTIILMIYLMVKGYKLILVGPFGIGFVILYELCVYVVGFRGIDSEKVYFETDPLDGKPRVYTEDKYIPRLEKSALNSKNRGND